MTRVENYHNSMAPFSWIVSHIVWITMFTHIEWSSSNRQLESPLSTANNNVLADNAVELMNCLVRGNFGWRDRVPDASTTLY